MSRYKKGFVVIVASLIGLLFVGNSIYKNYIRIQNIFDQMYYTRIRTHYDWWGGTMGGGGNEADSFSKMPQIEPVSRDSESYYTAEGYFEDRYMPEYLEKDESLVVICYRIGSAVEISARKKFNDFTITYFYDYDVKTKIMKESVDYYSEDKETSDIQEVCRLASESGLSKEDLIEYKKYFLYDKLLTDWLAVNPSRFSISDWGRVEFVEVLPLDDNIE